jgi:hypothetical protein
MNNLENVSSRIFTEFGSTGKSVLVHSEGNVLVVRVGNSETRIFNWQTTPIESILESTRSLTIKENYKGNVILHG